MAKIPPTLKKFQAKLQKDMRSEWLDELFAFYSSKGGVLNEAEFKKMERAKPTPKQVESSKEELGDKPTEKEAEVFAKVTAANPEKSKVWRLEEASKYYKATQELEKKPAGKNNAV